MPATLVPASVRVNAEQSKIRSQIKTRVMRGTLPERTAYLASDSGSFLRRIAGCIQPCDSRWRQLQLSRLGQVLQMIERRRAGDRRRDAGFRNQPRERDSCRRRMQLGSYRIQCVQYREAMLVQVFLHRRAARLAGRILL